jgi:hypothetical protein
VAIWLGSGNLEDETLVLTARPRRCYFCHDAAANFLLVAYHSITFHHFSPRFAGLSSQIRIECYDHTMTLAEHKKLPPEEKELGCV